MYSVWLLTHFIESFCQPLRFSRCKDKLQNLTEISWFAWVFWLVLCCAVWRQVTIEKNASTLMVCLGKNFPMNCSKNGHLYETFTNLFGWNIFMSLVTANKSSPGDLIISNHHRKIWVSPWFWEWDSDYSFFSELVRNLLVESWIYPNFTVIAYFLRSIAEF